MKNAIKVICFVLTVLLAGGVGGYVYFTWDVGIFDTIEGSNAGTVIITDYLADETDVVIPNRLRGKKVIAIDDSAFKETEITSVTFNDNIVSVGINAFQDCKKLVKVDMGSSVKSIGNAAFSNCPELTEVKFSPELSKLGHVIFGNDVKLTTLDINGNPNFKFENGVLYSADMTTIYETLVSADLSGYECPSSVVDLNAYAFYDQDELKTVKLNYGLKNIKEGTFIDCKNLTEITLPDSVVSIGNVIFSGSGVKTVKIPASVTKIDSSAFYNVEKQVTIVTTKDSYAAEYAKSNDMNLKIVDSL